MILVTETSARQDRNADRTEVFGAYAFVFDVQGLAIIDGQHGHPFSNSVERRIGGKRGLLDAGRGAEPLCDITKELVGSFGSGVSGQGKFDTHGDDVVD